MGAALAAVVAMGLPPAAADPAVADPAVADPLAAAEAADPAAEVGAAADRPGKFDETVLWDSADDPHESYHVQGLAVTPSDTILAFTEGRHEVCDAGPRDIVLRRSTDGGDSWEPSRIVVPSVDGQSWGNPTPVVDRETGEIFLFFGLSLLDPANTGCSGDYQEIYLSRSTDDGVTWTAPVELDELFAGNPYGWTLHGPGPGHGIQLENGRLVMQVLHRREVVGHTTPERLYGVSAIYSDDHGATWQAGEPVPVDVNYPINESRIYERGDGAIVVNGRSAAGGHRQRISAVSTDGGETWSDPVLEPATGRYTAVDAGFVRYEGPDGVSRLLHARPDSARREALTVSVSYDDGATYRYDAIVNPGPSYYSDLAVLSDGTILLFYGRDGEILGSPARLAMARFDLAWLTDGRDDGDGSGLVEHAAELGDTGGATTRPPAGPPATQTISPDVAGGNDAIVSGAPAPAGGGLAFDGDDHLEIPATDAVRGAGDTFTASAWFRTDGQDAQSILWAYGWGSATPQWWLRAEPGSDRIQALIDTGQATASLTAPGAYADGAWHHVALTRGGGTLELYVDGVRAAQAASPTGGLAYSALEGIHVGQRPDGANRLTGGVDEVRLYDRALTADEVAALAAARTADGAADAVVRLPLDETARERVAPPRPERVEDENARGGAAIGYTATGAGDYLELPFRVARDDGAFEVAVRYARGQDSGRIQVSIDGQVLPAGVLDPSLDRGAAYQMYQHGTAELGRGLHRIRFTLLEPGRLGGTTIAPDELTLIAAEHPSDEAHRDVVVDDESVGAFRMTGTWGRATGQAGHPYYGVSYRSAPAGTGDRTVSWQVDVPVTGEYHVLAWAVAHANRASDAPFTVHHADGATTVRVDQRGQARVAGDARPGVWVDLGEFRFEAGAAGRVELSNDADGFVIADAVMLTRDAVPGPVSGVNAAAVSPSTVRAGWTAVDGADGYDVEVRAAGTPLWALAGRVGADKTSLDVTGLAPSTAYEFRVYAFTEPDPGRPALAGPASAPVAATTPEAGDGEGDGTLALSVLSSRADAVTGGDALVRVSVADDGVPLDAVAVTVNDVDVTASLTPDPAGRALTGRVTGLHDGANVLAAEAETAASRTTARLTGHPIEGPVFSGPHEQPFRCETAQFTVPVIGGTLGAPLDENCTVADRVDYFYRTTGDTFAPWPSGAADYPADLVPTTTSDGAQVPFVVRMETGTVNRAVYQTTVLHDPLADSSPAPQAPPPAWNGATVFTFGGGCTNGWYRQGRNTGGVVDPHLLGQGYGLMSSSLNVFGSNCNDLTAAETASMVKEKFVERYGPVDHVIGFGCSGGSYQAYQIADNYPGILDGIIVGCSFPDVGFATVNMITDAWLLDAYFTGQGASWTEAERVAVTGFATDATAGSVAGGARRIDPRAYCAMVPAAQRYDPVANPRGVRCGVYDHGVNVYGRDPETGFARRPLDNVGIQYGLGALADGAITADQFLDLNEHVGGFDDDANLVPARTSGDVEAVRAAYRTGRLTSGGGGLATVPIIDYRTYRDDNPNGELHVRYHSFSMRERLEQANGSSANLVGLVEDMRYSGFSTESPLLRHAVASMDRWLRTLAASPSASRDVADVAAARPADLVEGCMTRDAEPVFVAERLIRDPSSTCEQLYPTASFPREVAGESVAANVVKCRLREPQRSDYGVDWTDAQWDRLTRVFADGVCDYSVPGVEQQPLAGTWLRF